MGLDLAQIVKQRSAPDQFHVQAGSAALPDALRDLQGFLGHVSAVGDVIGGHAAAFEQIEVVLSKHGGCVYFGLRKMVLTNKTGS